MVMPMSNPYAFPHSLGSQTELGRLEKRVNSYRRYHEATLSQSEAVAPTLIDECQQQTDRLRDRLVTSKSKKKRSEPRREAPPAAAAAASPAETTSAIKRTLEPEEDSMKQPKIEPGLESSLALTATATSTVNFVPKSEPVSSCISSSIGAGVVTTSGSSHTLPCGVSAAAALSSNTSSSAAVKSEAAALMDDLFGETGDIDYEHVLRQLANGDDGAPPSTEIPDIGDLSRIIEGAEYGETLSQVALSAASSAVDSLFDCDVTTQSHGGPGGGPASAILRTMAERLGGNGTALAPSLSSALQNDPSSLAVSGSSGDLRCSSVSVPLSSPASCPPAAPSSVTSVSSVGGGTCTTSTDVSPVPHPHPQLPSVSAAAIMHQQDGSGGPPKLTMQQRLKLKRQMMADEFRQTQYRQQQQQQQQQQQHSQLLQPTSMPQCSPPASSASVTASASLAPSTPLSYQQHQQHQLMMQQQRHHHQQQQMMMAAAQQQHQQQQQMARHPHQQQMMMMHPSGRLVAPGGAGTVMFAPSSAVHMQRYPVSGMESVQALPVQPGMTMAGQRMMLRPQGHVRPAVQHQMMAAHPQMMSQQMMHQQQLQHPHQQMAMAAFPVMQHPVQQQQQMTASATSEQEFRAMAMSASSAAFRPHQFQ